MFSAAVDWKQSLNPAQLEAVTCGDGPVLVIAGAGTGKTWTLACRVAYLIEQGVPAERILLLTFSRRAAREMLSRAGRLVDVKQAGKVWGGTFHAIANRLLRVYGRPLGVSPDFTVLDQADMADLMDLIRGEQQSSARTDAREQRRFPRKDTLVAIYSRMVNAGQALSGILQSGFPWCVEEADGIRSIFAEYTRRKRVQNVLDYDDLLLFWRGLGATPSAQQVAGQFEHVLVDEYQDTNPLQAQVLQSLRAENRNVMVVGDDAQAIYAFRGASVRNILDFPLQFPDARRITLEQNYRSTRPILDLSNGVIAHARERFAKDLWPVRSGGARPVLITCSDESEQSHQVCEQVLEHRERGVPLRQQVVLFRTGHHSDLLELELTRRNIPFVKFGGLKFLESAHVKDVLAMLRLLENPRDEVSWFRVLQLLDGIGPAGARSIIQALGLGNPAAAPMAKPHTFVAPLENPVSGGLGRLRHTSSLQPAVARPGQSTAGASGEPPPAGSAGAPALPTLPSHLAKARELLPRMQPGRPAEPEWLDPSEQPGASRVLSRGGQSAEPGSLTHHEQSGEVLATTGPGQALAPQWHRSVDQPDGQTTPMSPLLRLLACPPKVPEATQASLDCLRETFGDCLASGETLPPAAEIARIRRFCEPIFRHRYSSPEARLRDIEQLEQVASAQPSRGRFLSELALDPPTSTSDLAGPPLVDEDYLILSTVHSAKGGEWDVVHVIHAADGMIPSDMSTGDDHAIEEERRLFYVALTRARDNLYIYFALRFYRRPRGLDDAHHLAQLTRFLPEQVRSLCERRTAGQAGAPAVPTGPSNNPREGVDALLTALWEA